MIDLVTAVDWSRAQFALTAMYHWLFVPLTIGLSLIVAIMETAYYRTGRAEWKRLTRFWMTVFAINFACGVATGIILEFEFGTNWSNYSWFVGDIFGAPLAIEGLFAFFLESTFVAVMFFGWDRVSARFHLLSTWLVALGVILSALWILVANAWMQNPAGMVFSPDEMRNEMVDFWAIVLNPVAINKFLHAVFSGWALGAAFVLGVSGWMFWRKRSQQGAMKSVRVATWVGLAGMVLTLWTGDGSAVQVARTQPMKLAAMEGMYEGSRGADLIAIGTVTERADRKTVPADNGLTVKIPGGLSLLATHSVDAFVPGINDIIDGISINAAGDTVQGLSYAEKIRLGQVAKQALESYTAAREAGNMEKADSALTVFRSHYPYFGYGFLESPEQAIPPVALTFYSFRVMVVMGGFLLLAFLCGLFVLWRRRGSVGNIADKVPAWLCWVFMFAIPAAWLSSQAGWVVAEVGRQPWAIQDILPVTAAISDIPVTTVRTTFWIFAILFTGLLIAEISILLRYIGRESKKGI